MFLLASSAFSQDFWDSKPQTPKNLANFEYNRTEKGTLSNIRHFMHADFAGASLDDYQSIMKIVEYLNQSYKSKANRQILTRDFSDNPLTGLATFAGPEYAAFSTLLNQATLIYQIHTNRMLTLELLNQDLNNKSNAVGLNRYLLKTLSDSGKTGGVDLGKVFKDGLNNLTTHNKTIDLRQILAIELGIEKDDLKFISNTTAQTNDLEKKSKTGYMIRDVYDSNDVGDMYVLIRSKINTDLNKFAKQIKASSIKDGGYSQYFSKLFLLNILSASDLSYLFYVPADLVHELTKSLATNMAYDYLNLLIKQAMSKIDQLIQDQDENPIVQNLLAQEKTRIKSSLEFFDAHFQFKRNLAETINLSRDFALSKLKHSLSRQINTYNSELNNMQTNRHFNSGWGKCGNCKTKKFFDWGLKK